MRTLTLFVMLAMVGCVAPAQPIERLQDGTNADIRMDENRDLIIYYDDRPNIPFAVPEGGGDYEQIIELAGGHVPGERKRLPVRGLSYAMTGDAYMLYTWATGAGGTYEQAPTTIGRLDRRYRCYHDVLQAAPNSGYHITSASNTARIEACLEALPPLPASQ